MKKKILVLLIIFIIPVIVHPVPDEGVTIKKLSLKPVPFNERRNPSVDSPYNAFDGDIKTAALYSDFTIEFSKAVTLDTIKVMNGNSSSRELFKKNSRLRDIEITLYAQMIKPEKKSSVKKIKKPVPVKKDDRKIPGKENDSSKQDIKDKMIKDKDIKIDQKKEKDEKDKKVDGEKIKKEENEKKKEEKKDDKKPAAEKVVSSDFFNTTDENSEDVIKLFFTASEISSEPEKNITGENKTGKNETEIKKVNRISSEKKKDAKENKTAEKKQEEKKSVNKKSDPKSEKNKDLKNKSDTKKTADKKKVTDREESAKKVSKKTSSDAAEIPVEEKKGDRNIIEITDSKKITHQVDPAKKNTDVIKSDNSVSGAEDSEETARKKILAGEDFKKNKTEKKSESKNKKKEKTVSNLNKKTSAEKEKKKENKGVSQKKPASEIKKKEDENISKEYDKNVIKTDKPEEKQEKDKLPASDIKISEDKKTIIPATEKKESDKSSGKKISEKMDNKKKSNKKNEKKPVKDTVKAVKKDDKKKDHKIITSDKKPEKKVEVKKMTGVLKVDNENSGRVLIYATLKDSMTFQSINLRGKYSVIKIDFRTRDDEYYKGTEEDRPSVTEIEIFNDGKRIPLQNVDAMKKSYLEKYGRALTESVSGETFIMNENNEPVLRMTFKRNGDIEFHDRYKCRKKGDSDCTSISMPDKWKVSDGMLYMRYNTVPFMKDNIFWRQWKYELDYPNDILNDNEQKEYPRWMKLYYKTDSGYSERYLDLVRSEGSMWSD